MAEKLLHQRSADKEVHRNPQEQDLPCLVKKKRQPRDERAPTLTTFHKSKRLALAHLIRLRTAILLHLAQTLRIPHTQSLTLTCSMVFRVSHLPLPMTVCQALVWLLSMTRNKARSTVLQF